LEYSAGGRTSTNLIFPLLCNDLALLALISLSLELADDNGLRPIYRTPTVATFFTTETTASMVIRTPKYKSVRQVGIPLGQLEKQGAGNGTGTGTGTGAGAGPERY